MQKDNLHSCNIVIVGHVDHGKSSLIGRLLFDTDSLPESKLEELENIAKKQGTDIEWSFVLDALRSEREQAVTIDTTQIFFKTSNRKYVIIDAPGHREFLKNMISGAAHADGAVLVIDAIEGMQEQTKKHAYLLSLLGIKQVIVAINKMDTVSYLEEKYKNIVDETKDYLVNLGITAIEYVPITAKTGDNITNISKNTPWYRGKTILNLLDEFKIIDSNAKTPMRFSVQDIYRDNSERIIIGRVEAGRLSVADDIVISPSNEKAKIKEIKIWPEDSNKQCALQGEAIGITIDRPLFVSRGYVISHAEDLPIISNMLYMNIFYLADTPLAVGDRYKMKILTREFSVIVREIRNIISTDDLSKKQSNIVQRNEIAEVIFETEENIVLDSKDLQNNRSRAVLIDGYDIIAGGIIEADKTEDKRNLLLVKSKNITSVEHLLDFDLRAKRNGHKGAVIWFTGLSGAGKSTIAMQAEKILFNKGYQVYVLDGDNVRQGLNSDLGFSPEDRAENIRRIGEVAALMADAGLVVITAFISPYTIDRNMARQAAKDKFHEIYIKASIEECENRDPKSLYKKARAGEIKDFTGISAPYEPPDSPELVIDTEKNDIEKSISILVDYIDNNLRL